MKYFDHRDVFASIRGLFQNETEEFETEFKRYLGARYAIGTSYGRTALYAGLRVLDVRDWEVIVPAFTCTVVRDAVTKAGARPRFVDVDSGTFDLIVSDLKEKISAKTKGIILTHYFGRVARNISEVVRVARDNGIMLIEDCAHSLGAEYDGRKIGTFGDFSIFSLTKNMVNYGGGFLVTDNEVIYRGAREILHSEIRRVKTKIADFPLVLAYGIEQAIGRLHLDRVGDHKWWLLKMPRYVLEVRKCLLGIFRHKCVSTGCVKKRMAVSEVASRELTYEYPLAMEPIIASVGRNQLKKLDVLIERRREICHSLDEYSAFHVRNDQGESIRDVYSYLALRFKGQDIFDIIERCKERGLVLRATWPTHQRLWESQDTENVLKIAKEMVTWNVSPEVSAEEIERFKQAVASVKGSRRVQFYQQIGLLDGTRER